MTESMAFYFIIIAVGIIGEVLLPGAGFAFAGAACGARWFS